MHGELRRRFFRFTRRLYRVDRWRDKGLLGAANPQLWDEMAAKLAEMPT